MYKNGRDAGLDFTHFQGGFQYHSNHCCNTELKAGLSNVYSQQGGSPSTAGLALGCGKELKEELTQLPTAAA